MPQYVVLQSHPPDNCPMTNKAAREFAKKSEKILPKLQKELRVKVLLNLHLDLNHKAFLLIEAPKAEAVRDYLVRGGYIHSLENELYLVNPVEDLLKASDSIPTIY
jgi:hypothetical protein